MWIPYDLGAAGPVPIIDPGFTPLLTGGVINQLNPAAALMLYRVVVRFSGLVVPARLRFAGVNDGGDITVTELYPTSTDTPADIVLETQISPEQTFEVMYVKDETLGSIAASWKWWAFSWAEVDPVAYTAGRAARIDQLITAAEIPTPVKVVVRP